MMNTRPFIQMAAAAAILTAWHSPAFAQTHKVVNKANNPMPIVIAVLSDHYTDESKFDNDVKNFIDYGLLAHEYYGAHRDDLQIETFFDPVDAGKKSDFNFDPDIPAQDCDLTWDQSGSVNDDTSVLVNIAVSAANPAHTVVIGDYGYNVGCTSGSWSYVGRDAMGSDVLPHELGHALGSLKDEWVDGALETTAHPGIRLEDTRNCYFLGNGATPPWANAMDPAYVPGADSIHGCDRYGAEVVHAFPDTWNGDHYCLMGATDGAKFCPVCAKFMDQRFADENPASEEGDDGRGSRPPAPPETPNEGPGGTRPPTPRSTPQAPSGVRIIKTSFQQPPAKGQTPGVTPPNTTIKPVPTTPIIRLVVSFNPANGAITAKKGIAINARYTASHRRLGEYVYEIIDGNRPIGQQTLEVGVLASNLFTARSYQGALAHQTAPGHSTDITIQIPYVTAAMLTDPKSAIAIRIWWLMPGVNEPLITPAVFNALRSGKRMEPRGEISAAQLRNVM